MMQVYLNGRVAETHCKISTPLTLQCTLLKFQLINRSDIAQGPFSVTPNERSTSIQNSQYYAKCSIFVLNQIAQQHNATSLVCHYSGGR